MPYSRPLTAENYSSKQLKFTGIVVTYNDERHLRNSLNSLTFCDQLLVFDLGSSDNSVAIAHEIGAQVLNHGWVPIADEIRQKTLKYSRNEWVIFIDPDEEFPRQFEYKLRKIICEEARLGIVEIPWLFFFKGRPLYNTIWGKKKYKGVIMHKERVILNPMVHETYEILSGFRRKVIESQQNYILKHYWIDTYKQLFEKHWRYIKLEGEAKYNRGFRFSWKYWIKETLSALKTNLVDCRGLYGGGTGIFLSFFYAWYVSMSLLSLRQYQKKKSYYKSRYY